MTEQVNCAWQMVTCAGCGYHYQCTPSNDYDYYNSTTLEDGVCEPCLFSGRAKGANPPGGAE